MKVSTTILILVVTVSGCVGLSNESSEPIDSLDQRYGDYILVNTNSSENETLSQKSFLFKHESRPIREEIIAVEARMYKEDIEPDDLRSYRQVTVPKNERSLRYNESTQELNMSEGQLRMRNLPEFMGGYMGWNCVYWNENNFLIVTTTFSGTLSTNQSVVKSICKDGPTIFS